MIIDFAFVMVVALVITGLIWGLDAALWAPKRRRKADELAHAGKPAEAVERARQQPILVEYSRAFFPVILAVFLLRSFVVEPFRIPSGSMLPTLVVGDFILVNKFIYGIRIPVINKKIIDVSEPKRGDVMVFRYPGNPAENYIKRVIGLPGDTVVYRDKQLYINGKPVQYRDDNRVYSYTEAGEEQVSEERFTENLDGERHKILLGEDMNQEPMEFKVPPGHYFVMGDNRDHSNDSRYWGYVPEANIVGKAFLIWFSWDVADGGGVNWGRLGKAVK